MKTFWLMLIMALCATCAFATGNITGTYAYNPLDSMKGVAAQYENDFGIWDLETDGSIAQGNILEGDAHFAVAFDVGPIQLKPFTEINFVKTEDFGHTLDGGAKINVPIDNVDVAIGVFHRTSDAFVPLQQGTRNPVTGEVKWADATLLDFNDLGAINALFETKFRWQQFDFGITGIFDISNQQFHQVITEIGTSWQVAQSLQFSIIAEYITQVGENAGRQLDFIAGFGYNF